MRRLLIVDDDAAIRRLLRLQLGEEYEIVDTDDPEQALALAMEHKPDAILLDLRMPTFSGFDLYRTFNSFSQTHMVPIFVVSGELGEDMKKACESHGAAGFFPKPIDFDALKSRLATVKRHTMVPRSEIRVQIRVALQLHGTDANGKDFQETTMTDNVSLSGFRCTCEAALQTDAVVEVSFAKNPGQSVGTARCVRFDSRDGTGPQYAFRFVQKTGTWILQ